MGFDRPAVAIAIILFILMASLIPWRVASAASPPSVLSITQSPDGSSSDSPVPVGTVISYTIVAQDPDVPPAATLKFIIYWDYLKPDGSSGDLTDNYTSRVATDSTGTATLSTTRIYAAIGPWQQRDLNGDGRNDTGGWFLWVEVDDGGPDGPGISAAYTFLVVPLGNQPPVITSSLPSVFSAIVNPPNHTMAVEFSFSVSDPDNDTLSILWEYGDGTTETATTGPAAQAVQVAASHVYDANISQTNRFFNWTARAAVADSHDHTVVAGPTLVSMYVTLDYGPIPSGSGISYSPRGPERSPDYPFVYNGAPITFSYTAADPKGDPLTYSWDFEDDGTIDAVGQIVSWTFHGSEALVVHKVRVFVTDGNWKLPASAHNITTTVEVYSRNNARPTLPDIPAFNATFDWFLENPLVFKYFPTDRDGDNLTFQVDYGDGQFAVIAGVHNDTYEAAHDMFGVYNLTFNHTYTESSCSERANYTSGSGKQLVILRSNCVYRGTIWALDGHTEGGVISFRVLASSSNRPPEFTGFQASQEGSGIQGYFITNNTITFTVLNLTDNDSDSVTVTIQYGDGQSDTQVVSASAVPQNVVFQHTYRIKAKAFGGEFFVARLNITDNRVGVLDHQPHQQLSVKVEDPFTLQEEPPWDVVDYSSLTAVLALPVGLFILGRRRAAQQEEEEV